MLTQKITFSEAIELLEQSGKIILPTLGGNRNISFERQFDFILITNSKGNSIKVNELFFNKVVERIESLELNIRLVARYYTSNYWKLGNPSTVFAPYLVSLYNYLLYIKNTNNTSKIDFVQKYHFEKVGEYFLNDEKLPDRIILNDLRLNTRVSLVYAFFINDVCKYVGKSIRGYNRPFNYHKNKNMPTVNSGIINALNSNAKVDIYVRISNVNYQIDGLNLNLIEPIERALIALYKPEWNNLF